MALWLRMSGEESLSSGPIAVEALQRIARHRSSRRRDRKTRPPKTCGSSRPGGPAARTPDQFHAVSEQRSHRKCRSPPPAESGGPPKKEIEAPKAFDPFARILKELDDRGEGGRRRG
jgi:hypothetical protein